MKRVFDLSWDPYDLWVLWVKMGAAANPISIRNEVAIPFLLFLVIRPVSRFPRHAFRLPVDAEYDHQIADAEQAFGQAVQKIVM